MVRPIGEVGRAAGGRAIGSDPHHLRASSAEHRPRRSRCHENPIELSMPGKRVQFERMIPPMTNRKSGLRAAALVATLMLAGLVASPGRAADEPDLIFRRSTVFKWLTPNDKLATYGLDDPEVDGVACHFTVPEKGGLRGWIGVAEEDSDISLACRQIGPIRFKKKFAQGEDVFRARRSLFFKKMQIVRGCDTKRNVLYMVYSHRLIEGSPKNSTSTV